MINTQEYKQIKEFYGDRRALRSGVPYINHIDEGLIILHEIGASDLAKRAYCLHPLLQTDYDYNNNYNRLLIENTLKLPVLINDSYRKSANEWLSNRVQFHDGDFYADGIPHIYGPYAVREMLIADKIQNYKDFILYQKSTHHRSQELEIYFKIWLGYLKIRDFNYFFKILQK